MTFVADVVKLAPTRTDKAKGNRLPSDSIVCARVCFVWVRKILAKTDQKFRTQRTTDTGRAGR